MRSRLRPILLVLALVVQADRARATVSLILSIIEAVSGGLVAYGLKLLVDAVIAGDGRGAATAAAVIALMRAADLVANWGGFMIRMKLRERTEMAVDLRLVELTLDIPGLEHLERPDYADKIQLLRQERSTLAAANEALTQNAYVVTQALTTVGLLMSVHPLLVVLPLFGLPPVFAAARAERWSNEVREAIAEPSRTRGHYFTLATTPSAGKEVRIFGIGRELMRRYREIGESIHRRTMMVDTKVAAIGAAGWVLFSASFAGAILFVLSQAARHPDAVSVGDVALTLALGGQVVGQVTGARIMATFMAKIWRTAERFAWLHDHAQAASAAARPTTPLETPERLVDGIAFEGVSFRYPGTDSEVLSDVTLHLPAGSTVALVGDNGAGKTTLVKLLGRFYDPDQGRITVDGAEVRSFDVGAWRSRMAAAFQDFAKFELIAREAIGVGDLELIEDRAAVMAALDRAGAPTLVDPLPNGIETQLGKTFEGGIELSGGQWQKLALGRAMMRTAPLVLVLDEPTAALDPQSEHALFERYAEAARMMARQTGGITILVSHRFSTVRMADRIFVISEGRVAEQGSHSDLVRQRGIYAELFSLQAAAYR